MNFEWILAAVALLVSLGALTLAVIAWRAPVPPDRSSEISDVAGRVEAVRSSLAEQQRVLSELRLQLTEVDSLRKALADVREAECRELGKAASTESAPTHDSIRASLASALAATSQASDRAFAQMCLDQLDELTAIHERTDDWLHESGRLEAVFAPKEQIQLYEVSEEWRSKLRRAYTDLEDLRADLRHRLATQYGIELIAPTPGEPFDPLMHEDTPATRHSPMSAEQAHTVVSRVSVGYRRHGEVVEKAWVTRFAGYEGATSERPPESIEIPEPGISPALTTLQKAAEHGDD